MPAVVCKELRITAYCLSRFGNLPDEAGSLTQQLRDASNGADDILERPS